MSKDLKDPNLGVCVETSCKEYSTRFNFCNKHYEEFKFGVIKKNGQRPTDYEKKMDAYNNYLRKAGK